MKKTLILCFSLVITCFCHAQYAENIISDSLVLRSRAKADVVLSKFDTISGKKMLYALSNKNYYVIIQSNASYKEYVISIDSTCNVLSIKEIDNSSKINDLRIRKCLSKNQQKYLKRLETDRQMLNKSFNTNQYSTEPITTIPNATYIAGVPSYFVIKDEDNNRYGEYSLSSITTPCPINPNLWAYLIRELLENIK